MTDRPINIYGVSEESQTVRFNEIVISRGDEKKNKKEKEKEKEKKMKPEKKAPVKQAAKVKKVDGRGIGPGTKLFKFKADSAQGECDVLGCKSKAHSPKAFRCKKHSLEIRKAQLRENNLVWKKRRAKGEADHHVVYTNVVTGKQELTKWAVQHPNEAMARAKKGECVLDPEALAKLIAASKKAKAKVKGAKARVKN